MIQTAALRFDKNLFRYSISNQATLDGSNITRSLAIDPSLFNDGDSMAGCPYSGNTFFGFHTCMSCPTRDFDIDNHVRGATYHDRIQLISIKDKSHFGFNLCNIEVPGTHQPNLFLARDSYFQLRMVFRGAHRFIQFGNTGFVIRSQNRISFRANNTINQDWFNTPTGFDCISMTVK